VRNRIDISKEVLEDLYINHKLSSREVAKRLGISQGTVLNKMKEFNIKIRPQSEGFSFLGKHFSEDSKKKISQSHIGLSPSEETKKKLSKAKKGRKLSEETKAKISKANRGKTTGCIPPNWKGGIVPENKKTRNSLEMK
jgi:TyrR family helix-turn-helix protein